MGAPQSDILTVTLNPALDLATTVPQVIAGPKLRCTAPRFDPGGGGVNVARTIRKLGGQAQALLAIGGATGARILDLLAAEGVPTLPVSVSGDTRQSFAVTEDATGAQFRFGVPGELMSATDAAAIVTTLSTHLQDRSFVVISGSMAPGLPADYLDQLIATMAPKTPRIIVDTAGSALTRLIAKPLTPVAMLRVDDAEAVAAAGRPLPMASHTADFAAELIARGVAETIVIGRGAEGSVLVSGSHRILCSPPAVEERSKVGAGDAMVGGMTLALARGQSADQALRWGAAAASATVSTEGTALCDLATAEARFAECKLHQL